MFILYANKGALFLRAREQLTSGSVNIYRVCFEFSPDWAGLTRKVVFKAGKESRTVLLDDGGECVIPWEVLTSHGQPLMAGVFGAQDDTVLPTAWANLGSILEGVPTDAPGAQPPTPDAWEQELAGKQDKLRGVPGQVVGFDELGNAAAQDSTGGGGGISDHRLLTGRDAGGQHPISAIDGLPEELNRIPGPVEALTNEELEALLK